MNGWAGPVNLGNAKGKLPKCAKKFLSQFYGYEKALLDAITYSTNGIPGYVPIQARAFTLGDHIYFDFNEFDPRDGISDGEMILLAHEITHGRQYRRYGKKTLALSYLWQSGKMGVAGYYWGGALRESVGFHMAVFGNEYEQEAYDEEAFIRRQIGRFGQPCR